MSAFISLSQFYNINNIFFLAVNFSVFWLNRNYKYILLDVLLCSIAEYFYELGSIFTSWAVFWRARRASQNTSNE